MAEQIPVNPEEMARLLRVNMQKRRPRSLLTFLILLVVFVAPVALLVWWVWPRPLLPRLMVITFDEVTLPDRPVSVRARLIPQEVNVLSPDLSGVDVAFEALDQRPEAKGA